MEPGVISSRSWEPDMAGTTSLSRPVPRSSARLQFAICFPELLAARITCFSVGDFSLLVPPFDLSAAQMMICFFNYS